MLSQIAIMAVGALMCAPVSVATPLSDSPSEAIDKRDNNVVWVNTFSPGNCGGQFTKADWFWSGLCKNIPSGTYGATFGNSGNPWPNCAVKFWELPNCHGHATEFHPDDWFGTGKDQYEGVYNGFYNCMPVANKQGKFYLGNGAASISVQC